MRCLVFHTDGHGQCLICACGAHVRPHEWLEHIGAAVEALSAKRDAEAAVIAAAKAFCADRSSITLTLEHQLIDAVAALRAVEGDV
jgi:hypothetical protein